MKPRIGIIGGAGLTGRQLAGALAESDFALRLGGRNLGALQAVAGPIGAQAWQLDLFDAKALDRFLQGLEVVVNCAGPFVETGVPVAESCLRSRVHMLDIAGELPWARRAKTLFERQAREAGVSLCVAAGLEVGPLDCLVAEGVAFLGGVTQVQTAGWVSGFLPSQSSARSAIRVAAAPTFGRRRGCWYPRRPAGRGRTFAVGPPLGRKFGIWMPTIEAATVSWWAPEATVEGHFVCPRWAQPGVFTLGQLARVGGTGVALAATRILSKPRGDEPFAFAVELSGPNGNWRNVFSGRGVYETTALILCDIVKELLDNGPRLGRGGVVGPAMLIDPVAALTRWRAQQR